MDKWLDVLSDIVNEENVRCNEMMSAHTTFRIGGPADYFVMPKNESMLLKLMDFCKKEGIPWYVVGNGSNLLVADKGIRGIVISLEKGWNDIRIEGTMLYVGGGTMLSRAAKAAADRSLTGMEFAAGIPGTVGGAVVMNAGAYGQEIKDVLCKVKVLTKEGDICWILAQDLELGYRTSCVKEKEYLVLEAVFCLNMGEKDSVYEKMAQLAASRREKQPLEYPSAGSTFKRPVGFFAGKLIDDAGLRGFSVGGAAVSDKHCGFVINKDHATAQDVLELCVQIQKQVQEQFGVLLEMEVKKVGEF